jgi:hypothetical protein
MSGAVIRARPRAWRLQFSLRVLLVAFTAFAIGFPVWYRWPYVEIVEKHDGAGNLLSKRTITWQRQWGGGRLMHGTEETTQMVGGTPYAATTTYVKGMRQGPYTTQFAKTRFSQKGQYLDDMKEGRWIAQLGEYQTVTNWHRDLRHGDSDILPTRGERLIATFEYGRLTKINGKPVDDPLFDVLMAGALPEAISRELEHDTNIDMVEMPLKDVMMFVRDLHKIPVVVDLKGGFFPDVPINAEYRGIDLRSALVLLLAPHGLACDYRYGALWITKLDRAKDWNDPTGVANIKPPPGSALARAWNEPMAVDSSLPLADIMAYIGQKMAVAIDSSRVSTLAPEPVPIGPSSAAWNRKAAAMIRDQPLKHVLGRVLYNAGCRCELEGERLVILPPDDK